MKAFSAKGSIKNAGPENPIAQRGNFAAEIPKIHHWQVKKRQKMSTDGLSWKKNRPTRPKLIFFWKIAQVCAGFWINFHFKRSTMAQKAVAKPKNSSNR